MTPDLDLDAAPDPSRSGAPVGTGSLVLAVGLAGLVVGLLTGSALGPPDPARRPPLVTLSTRDLYLDTTAATGETTAPVVVVLRLQVVNPASTGLRLRALSLDGVTDRELVLPANDVVPAHGSITHDFRVRPDCRADRPPATLEAQLTFTGSSGSSGSDGWTEVPATRGLGARGGLCSQIDLALPRGWQSPLVVSRTAPHGRDLEITVDRLTRDQLTGAVGNNQLRPTIFVGDQSLPATVRLLAGRPAVLRLQGPPPCVQTDRGSPAVSTIQLLANGPQGIEQRLVVIGPALTRWLRTSCDGTAGERSTKHQG